MKNIHTHPWTEKITYKLNYVVHLLNFLRSISEADDFTAESMVGFEREVSVNIAELRTMTYMESLTDTGDLRLMAVDSDGIPSKFADSIPQMAEALSEADIDIEESLYNRYYKTKRGFKIKNFRNMMRVGEINLAPDLAH